LNVESAFGRVRSTERYSSRLIDIDILLYEDIIIYDQNLKIPHPLLDKRRFVLEPLCEIAPGVIHPILNKTMLELLQVCEDRSNVIIFDPGRKI
jgi:2-amino-4-hydroxy-6-hydroxymethyldihydropteridine diphosphokinase